MPTGGSLLTLTYGGATRVVPCYNVMGVAKAALEASVRYLAADFGAARYPRQCALGRADAHAGRRRHLRCAHACFNYQQRHAPMRRSPTLDEVGGAGLYLLSDLSGAVTGEVHFVDCGYNDHRHADAPGAEDPRAGRGSRVCDREGAEGSGAIASAF